MGNAQTKAKRKYNKANYDTILLSLPKGVKSQLKAFAAEQKISVNRLLNDFVIELLENNTDISIEQQKVTEELHQEAEAVRKNLKTMQKAVEAKPNEYLIKRKGFSPMPNRKLIELLVGKREAGYSYEEIAAFTKELTGHKFAAKTIGTKIEDFIAEEKAKEKVFGKA